MDRYMMRIREMCNRRRILRQALAADSRWSRAGQGGAQFQARAGECQIRVESARGDQGWYVVSDGTGYPWRVHVRTGSFAAMGMTKSSVRD